VIDWINADGARWAQARGAATGVPAEDYLREFQERSSPLKLLRISDAAIASQQASPTPSRPPASSPPRSTCAAVGRPPEQRPSRY
jgi:hypothetical protein